MSEKLHAVWPILAEDRVGDAVGDARPIFVVSRDGRFLRFANAAAARFLGLAPARTLEARIALEPRLGERLVRFAAASDAEARELIRFFDGLRSTLLSVVFHRLAGVDDAILVTLDKARPDPADADPAASLQAIAAEGGLVALFDGNGDVTVALGDHAALDGVQEDIEAALDDDTDAAIFERRVVAGGRAHDVALVRLGDAPRPRRLLWVGPAVPVEIAPPAETPVVAPTRPESVETPEAVDAADAHTPVATVAEVETRALEAPLPVAPPELPEAEVPASGPSVASTEILAAAVAAVTEAAGPATPEMPTAVEPTVDARPAVDAPRPDEGSASVAAAVEEPVATPLPAIETPAAAEETVASVAAPASAAAEPSDAAPLPEPAADAGLGFRFVAPGRSVKFVWQMDAERRFTHVSDELAGVVGPHAAALTGRTWREVAADLGLDPEGRIAAVLDRRDTWSGRTVLWPVEGEALRLPIDLAALPAFDRGRIFAGFRGFGTVRGDGAVPDPTATGLRLAAATAARADDTDAEPARSFAAADAMPASFPDDGETASLEATHPAPVAAALDAGEAAFAGEIDTVATPAHSFAEADAMPASFPGDAETALLEAAHPVPLAAPLDAGEAAFAGEIDAVATPAPACADALPVRAPDDAEAKAHEAARPAALDADEAPLAEAIDAATTPVRAPTASAAAVLPDVWLDDELALAMATLPACDDDFGIDEPPAAPATERAAVDESVVPPAPSGDAVAAPASIPAPILDTVALDAANPADAGGAVEEAASSPEAEPEPTAPVAAPAVEEEGPRIILPRRSPPTATDAAAEPATPAATRPEPTPAPAAVTPSPAAAPTTAVTPVVDEPAAPVADARIAGLAASTRPPVEATRLSPPERVAFRQIGEALGARLDDGATDRGDRPAPTEVAAAPATFVPMPVEEPVPAEEPVTPAPRSEAPAGATTQAEQLPAAAPPPQTVPAETAVAPLDEPPADEPLPVPAPVAAAAELAATPVAERSALAEPVAPAEAEFDLEMRLLDRLPTPVAVIKDDALVYANDAFLRLLAYPDLATLEAEGGLDGLFAGEHVARRWPTAADGGRPLPMLARDGRVVPVDATVATIPWAGTSALMLTITEVAVEPPAALLASAVAPAEPAPPVVAPDDRAAPMPGETPSDRVAELEAILDTATDGILMLEADGTILSANQGAEALFGIDRREMIGRPLADRLAPESRRSAMDYLDGLARNGVASVLNDGREVIGAVDRGGLIPLFMTIGRISTAPARKYCAVLRDITHWKKSEEDLTAARRRAEEASVHKSDFLAKISHEIRTPLNAIIGFSEVMMDERFGPIGNERYKDYLRDIHASGSHIMSLINDLLDLSKVEAGKMDLRFEAVALGDIMAECVAMMQPQANRERIIIRSSLPAGVPPVVADPRSVRQVMLNLLSNAIKFTPSGGQVIVSTTLEDSGEVVMRVRDTGYGMTEKELQTAMEPFRQLHTTRSRGGGTGLGLPLTKALVEANRAVFRIDSTVGQGTLVTVTFPLTRVLAS